MSDRKTNEDKEDSAINTIVVDTLWDKNTDLLNKRPFEPIIHFLEVNFDGHPTLLSLLRAHIMHNLLHDDYAISYLPSRHKTRLSWRY